MAAGKNLIDGRRWGRTGALLAGSLLAGLLAGCRASMPAGGDQPDLATLRNAELTQYIADMPLVTSEPAYRAVHFLWKGPEAQFEGDFAALRNELAQARIVDGMWNYGTNDFLDRAAVGYMLARVGQIRTGLNWQLFGLGRYAYRELVARDIAVAAGEMSHLSGGEFLGMMARTEMHMREKAPTQQPAAELGPEPGTE